MNNDQLTEKQVERKSQAKGDLGRALEQVRLQRKAEKMIEEVLVEMAAYSKQKQEHSYSILNVSP